MDLKTFLTYLKQIAFAGPISLHFEYRAQGAGPEEKFRARIADMERDLKRLELLAREAGLG